MANSLAEQFHQSGVSIIIQSHNNAEKLKKLLSSFFCHNAHYPFEFIIMDQASTDQTEEVIHQFAGKSYFVHLVFDQVYHFAVASNYAVSKAVYPKLLFIDINNNYYSTSDYLAQMTSIIKEPDIGAVILRQVGYPGAFSKTSKPAESGAYLLCTKNDFINSGGFNEEEECLFLENNSLIIRIKELYNKNCCHLEELSLEYLKENLSKNVATISQNVIAFDYAWQFPAITELQALNCVSKFVTMPVDMLYIAYPWATLIDKLQTKAKDAGLYLKSFYEFLSSLPDAKIKITVCQHIYMKQYIGIFKEAGITDVFWSHASQQDVAVSYSNNCPNIYPFPLYPTQIPKPTSASLQPYDDKKKNYLYSFVGARSHKFYLTQSRNFIIDCLSGDPRGHIAARDNWFYSNIVYDKQVRNSQKICKQDLSDWQNDQKYREILESSTFSLCPSGTGPNSIRLWESIAAGAIPVILADSWIPPGNYELWKAAVIFCPETEKAIKSLPDRLEHIAADAERLNAMRQALRQLWLLYGPDTFIGDIQNLILDLAVEHNVIPEHRVEATKIAGKHSNQIDQQIDSNNETSQVSNLDLKAPNIKKMLKVCLLGHHSNRTPLSYASIRKLAGEILTLVEDPALADFIITGFNRDISDNKDVFSKLADTDTEKKVVVLSEEPLWDLHWSGGFIERNRVMQINEKSLHYHFINHQNSKVFDFIHLPYFTLTDNRYLIRYSQLIRHFADYSSDQLLKHWRNASISYAFFVEKREGDKYAASYPEHDIWGLSAYRTKVAATFNGKGVMRVGKGWENSMRRQDLPDWHLDKLANLKGRTYILSAYENTHQNQYITEKIFDAFAVGAIPVYFAGPNHSVFDIVDRNVIINTYALDEPTAVNNILEFEPDLAYASAWKDAASELADRFSNVQAIINERKRVISECLNELHELMW